MASRILTIFATLCFIINIYQFSVHAYPKPYTQKIQSRTTEPYFPDSPASCPICAENYDSINSCAEAAPVLANFSMIIFNPGAFIDVIKCACTDTFQSVFPQCADCFERTNQTDVLDTPDLPSVVSGMRQVCSLASALLGNVSETDGEVSSSSSAAAATASATSSTSEARRSMDAPFPHVLTFFSVVLGAIFWSLMCL